MLILMKQLTTFELIKWQPLIKYILSEIHVDTLVVLIVRRVNIIEKQSLWHFDSSLIRQVASCYSGLIKQGQLIILTAKCELILTNFVWQCMYMYINSTEYIFLQLFSMPVNCLLLYIQYHRISIPDMCDCPRLFIYSYHFRWSFFWWQVESIKLLQTIYHMRVGPFSHLRVLQNFFTILTWIHIVCEISIIS